MIGVGLRAMQRRERCDVQGVKRSPFLNIEYWLKGVEESEDSWDSGVEYLLLRVMQAKEFFLLSLMSVGCRKLWATIDGCSGKLSVVGTVSSLIVA